MIRLLGMVLLVILAAPKLNAACVEGAENTSTAWSMSGLWHVIDATAVACAGVHSGTRAFYFGMDAQCNYDNGLVKDATLTSPPLFITGFGDTNFSFWTKWQVESMGSVCYDQLWVERYDPGSASWVLLREIGPVSTQASAAPAIGVASVTGLGGNPEWQFVQINLSAFAGLTMQLRFRFASGACLAPSCAGKPCGAPDATYDNFLGWVVDDISFGCPPGALTINKSASPAHASRNATITYTLLAENLDPAAASLSLWDTLPVGANFVSSSPPPSIQSGQFLLWNLPGIPSFATQSITVLAVVDASTPYPSDWSNTARGESSAGGAQFQSAIAPVKIRDTTLQIVKSAQPSTLTSGDKVTFTITLSNFTASTVASLDLNETYPQGFVELDAEPNYSSFRSWRVLGLAPGQTRYFTVLGFVNGFNGQTLVNKAEIFIAGASQGSATASVKLIRPEVPQIKVRTVYPNPAPSGKGGLPQSAFVVYEANQGMELTLDIFSVSGEKIRSIPFRGIRGSGQVEWDLKNNHGASVASGVYLARLWKNEPQLGVIEAWAHIAVLQ